jgi:hypothetical protein
MGRRFALDLRPTRPLTFLGPALAVVCGAVASGGLAPRGQTLLLLIFSLLLCDVLLGAWRALWLQPDWREAWRRSMANMPAWFGAAYAEAPRFAMARIAQNLTRRAQYAQSVVLPLIDSEIIAMLMAGGLALSVATVLGQLPTILTILAMAFALVEGLVGEERGLGLRALFEFGLPWLIAQTAFGYFSWLSFFFIVLSTLIYRALLGLVLARRNRWIVWSNVAQLVMVLALFASNAPVGAAVVALGLIAQVLWQTRYAMNHDGRAYAQHIQSYILVATLMAALSLWF